MDSQTNKQKPSGEKSIEVNIEQFWRPANEGDVGKVMRDEKVKARFRDDTFDKWTIALLGGYGAMSEHFNWIDIDGNCYKQCQVYDPPEILKNKPDPGEGYRLLEKFPPEPKQRHDWFWDKERSVWILVRSDGEQAKDVWYRRQIESNIPEKPDSCDGQDISEGHLIPFKAYVGVEIILPNGKRLKVTQSGFELL